ncbi:MAG: hypothetical protein HY917_01510 [Candidatus Diapherotrites archaeon]|nr:hypothetical protein [Candidatus Diapherotrites archaeon]
MGPGSIKISLPNERLTNELVLAFTVEGIFPYLKNTGRHWELEIPIETMKKIGPFLRGNQKEKFIRILKTHPFREKRMKALPNFYVDPVKEITPATTPHPFVYDLMVEGNKTFIAGQGHLGVYDCDGDQDSVMLLMDALLNFSTHYLPSSRGGRMDAPLVFTTVINPTEIDDEAYEIETGTHYPVEFYEAAQQNVSPDSIPVPKVKNFLKTPQQYSCIAFTHDTDCFDEGPKTTAYVQFKSMDEKMNAQAKLQAKIRAVNQKDALERVLNSHFIPDLIGNARAFSRQSFRCTQCNQKYRRIPLRGKCNKCQNGNLILTVNQGGVRKYLATAQKIVHEYELSTYMRQRVNLIEAEINSVFAPATEDKEQKTLAAFSEPAPNKNQKALSEFV